MGNLAGKDDNKLTPLLGTTDTVYDGAGIVTMDNPRQ